MSEGNIATLVLASNDEVTAILSMMEGMLDILKDDGLKDSPDAVDLEDARDWLSNAIEGLSYPAQLPIELSAAQQTMLRNAIANADDQGEFWDDGDGAKKPFTARIENYSGNP